MHANSRQLIALRDGEPVDAAVAEHLRECVACARRMREFGQLRDALRALPSVPPPADSWQHILARRELETLRRPSRIRHAYVAALVPVALAVLLAGAWPMVSHGPVFSSPAGSESVDQLRQRSRELEYLLQRYRQPGVMSLRTAGAVSELEDSIALIDYQLNGLPGANDGERQQTLWQQRVALMETLVTVRATEDYLDSI